MPEGSRQEIFVSLWGQVFVGLTAGIAAAHFNDITVTLTILASAVTLLLFNNLSRRVVATILVFMVGGFFYYSGLKTEPVNTLPEIQRNLTGQVYGFPTGDSTRTSFYLKTDDKNIYLRKIKVNAYFAAPVKPGDKIKIKGILKPPLPPSNPGEFDYPAYLARRQVFYIAGIKNERDLKMVKSQSGWQQWITSGRDQGQAMFNATLPGQEAAILNGMLLGKIDEIDPEREVDFQTIGIFHVFSVSGMHVGFLLLLNGWIMALLKTNRRNRLISGLLLLLLYGFLAAWPVSLQRAAIMGSLGLFAYYSGRQNNMLNALALAGVIILLVNPAALLDISFQLSFAATFGLVYVFPLIRSKINTKPCQDIILIPLCAEIMIIPLTVYYFSLFSPVSIIANIVTAYITGGIVILGFLGFISAQAAPILAPVFLIPAGALIEIMLAMVDLLKNIPGAYHWTGAREITMVLYYAALAAGLWGIGTNRCRAATAAGAGLALIMVSFYIPPGWNSHGQMKVVFIDVGQGDSILIKTPGGKFILIDGGGNQFYDVGRLKLLPYLHRCGINKLLMVVNTHPDIDHLGGLEPVLASTSVKYLAVPAGLDQAPEYSRLKKSKAEKFVPLKAGQIIKLEDNCFIKVLLPVNQTYALNNFNNQSLVLLLEYGQFRLLLTGDIETEAINHLLVSPPGPCTVVKIPHHGSRNSLSEPLYDITRPVYAVITAGRNNSFGHPHIEVTNTLESKGINILRTDRNGAITMTTDGQHLKVQNTLKGD